METIINLPTSVEIKRRSMNTPNNRRKKESIERIEKAFIELLQSRPLNQISVSELCKRARLNRTTFYANYADVYALADSIRDKLEKSFAQLYASERGQSFNSNDTSNCSGTSTTTSCSARRTSNWATTTTTRSSPTTPHRRRRTFTTGS